MKSLCHIARIPALSLVTVVLSLLSGAFSTIAAEAMKVPAVRSPRAQAKPQGPDPIVISGLTNRTVLPNRLTPPMAFSIAKAVAPLSNLKFTVESSRPELLQLAGTVFSGDGTNRTLQLQPTVSASGKCELTVRVEGTDGQAGAAVFELTILEELSVGVSGLPPLLEGAVAWGDADGDGDLDLVLGGASGNPATPGSGLLFLNEGGAVSPLKSVTLANAEAGSINVVDANRDGRADVFLTGGPVEAPSSHLFLQAAGGGFLSVSLDARVFPGVRRSASAWNDMNGDGVLDLALTGSSTSTARRGRVIQNIGPNLYTNIVQADIPPMESGSVVWTDFDGDGDADLLLSGSFDGVLTGVVTRLFLNEGERIRSVNHPFPDMYRSAISVADMDQDGDPDVVMSGLSKSGPQLLLGLNDGSGHFSIRFLPLPAVYDGDVALGDLDGDGLADIVLTGQTGQTGDLRQMMSGAWRNLGGGTNFTAFSSTLPAAYSSRVAQGDMDGDGDLDVAFLGGTNLTTSATVRSGHAAVFRNNINPGAAPRLTPEGLNSEITGNSVLFRWTPTRSGVSYNLRVGTSPGGADIVSVPTTPEGKLRIPQNGNAGWVGRWKLRGLVPGTYYWSVQEVDAAFHASPWAAEKSLTITNQSPELRPIVDQSGVMNSEIGPIPVVVNDPDGNPSDIQLDGYCFNSELVDPSGIRFVGTGTSRSAYIRPLQNANGGAWMVFRARDALGEIVFQYFRLSVQTVSTLNTGVPAYMLNCLDVGDVDHDGFPDLFVSGVEPTGPSSGRSYNAIFRNKAGKSFEETRRGFLGNGEFIGSWGDMDGDGRSDLAIGNRHLWDDAATLKPILDTGAANAAVAWGDYDGDGRLDLAYVGRTTKLAGLLRNTPAGWVSGASGLAPVHGGSIAWGDMDNDGDLDLAISGRSLESTLTAADLTFYRQDAGSFLEVKRVEGVSDGVLQWVDSNNDGRLDLVMAGNLPSGFRERLFLNQGGGQFTELNLAVSTVAASNFPGASLLDYDSDGILELIEFTPNGLFSLRRSEGNGRFSVIPFIFINSPSQGVRWADFDGDGDFDILVTGPDSGGPLYDGNTRLYLNHWKPASVDVVAPVAEVNGTNVTLRWPRRNDVGPGTPLTYNLRVGTKPGLGDVVSPASDLVSGRRHVVAPGAQGFATLAMLQGLNPGVYYWSVQPVDSASLGYPWGPEQSFVIAPDRIPLRIEFIDVVPGAKVHLSLAGPAAASCDVEISSDLKIWSKVGSTVLDVAGVGAFEAAQPVATVFYRLRKAP